ncbi:putative nad dependent epimerase dehydratase protein [Phaeoacremonium minimum UCRPA7]|uniref:Putative nad dependent epimerase dehydratase protein n=1 Tax=Phaeoacremonium minimum (strain UCR-PA7) TaxID=1286976 RepID=R8BXY6_PHAM7|nr:putative nad dependent epimerase dehydratase protein [Phaeoacremonium minimum UCRPA7]EOO04202.1 putative nad dependent epimerase dehydratase protein [Phaeoacremonium minimum UCRPA7]
MGWDVHATTRHLDSAAAKSLQAIGVQFSVGDWDNEETLREQIEGCSKLFLVMFPTLTDLRREVEQAKHIISIAKAAGVKQVLYTSAYGVQTPERSKHYNPNSLVTATLAAKKAIEDEIRNANFEYWTIIRPGWFMANFLEPKVKMYAGLTETNTWTTGILPDSRMPLIDHEDIAKFTIAAFKDPVRFNGRAFEIASDIRYLGDVIKSLGDASHRHIKIHFLTDGEIDAQKSNPLVSSTLVLRDMAQFVDFDEVKSWGIPVTTWEDFLRREKEAVEKTYPSPP